MISNKYIDIFKSQRILVIGDIILDVYYKGNVERISPEAPVPVVHINETKYALGGAANVSQNIANIASDVVIIGAIGDDVNGSIVSGLFKENIKPCMVKIPNHPTTTKIRAMSQNQQIVRMDFEEHIKYTNDLWQSLNNLIDSELPGVNCVIISDYNKGLITKEFSETIISKCKLLNIPVIIDPKGSDWEKYKGADVITPNIAELSDVAKTKVINSNDDVLLHGEYIRKKYSIGELIVTRSHLGVTRIGESVVNHIPTEAKEVYDVCGAGDTFISVLATAIAGGIPIEHSIYFANKAAGIVVSKVGTATITIDELFTEPLSNIKVIDSPYILKRIMQQGKELVFTNGCFDILHVGHVAYLKEAKRLGDVLVVGVNSDASIKRLKGESRPVNNLNDRLLLLAALECVDYVIPFDSDTPLELIKSIMPDILVKGGDYANKEIIGSEYAKEVRLIDFIDGYSSTNIIKKMQM